MGTTALTVGVNRLRRALGAAVAWGAHHPATAAGPAAPPGRPRRQGPPVPRTGRGVRR